MHRGTAQWMILDLFHLVFAAITTMLVLSLKDMGKRRLDQEEQSKTG
jgi:hypothetical protein